MKVLGLLSWDWLTPERGYGLRVRADYSYHLGVKMPEVTLMPLARSIAVVQARAGFQENHSSMNILNSARERVSARATLFMTLQDILRRSGRSGNRPY
jgi:hypothetical protein